MADYEFRYAPLTGRLTGKQMIEQTEQAINGLAGLVDEAAGQVEIISTLANEANENAATALETAEEALATTGRTYITVSIPANANDYFESQLIYIADATSTNIPVADTGMLEAKTNDDKTACEQVFIADSSGESYYRHGDITAETVGDVTTYTVTWGGWSSQPATQAYVQGELANYLPLSGGTMTGTLMINNPNGNGIIYNSNSTAGLSLYGNGASSYDGAALLLSSVNGTGAGKFYLRSPINSSDFMQLAGDGISGTLTWGGNNIALSKDVLALSGGTMTGGIVSSVSTVISRSVDDSYAQIDGGTAQANGAWIRLNGKNNTGNFQIRANNGTNETALVGNPTGALTWNSKEIERVNATSTNYIRYESGLQLCWGTVTSVNSSGVSVTFPVSFNATPAIMLSTTASSHCYYSGGSSTGFTAKSAASSATVIYAAVGWWK